MVTLSIPGNPAGRTAAVAAGLGAVLCLLLLLRLAVLMVDGVQIEFEPIPLQIEAPLPVGEGPVDWALFGRVQAAEHGLESVLPPTPLRLRLRGAVTGVRGYAIIIDEQGSEGVYRVDDTLPGDARVVAIEPRRVVLERGGVREALELPEGIASSGASRREVPAQAAPANSYPAAAGIGSLSGITSQFSLDPAELARRITILPVAGGGFRVRAGRDAAIFTQLGFHANDVVLAINGQPVDNQADVRAVFERWNPDDPLAITVRRGERQLVLTPGR